MENKHFIRIIDFLNINDNSCDEIIDNIDSNLYSILQRCYKNKGCKDFLPLIPKIDKHNIKIATALIFIMYASDGQCGLKKDRKKAIYWAKKMFDNFNVIEGGEALASMYMQNKQYKNAYDTYQILATINNHISLTALGGFYRKGIYIKKDIYKALEYYQKATKHGNLSAPIKIAGIYRQQRKYLKSLVLLVKTIAKRIYIATTDKDAQERFREM
jgi:TPR repeat protein